MFFLAKKYRSHCHYVDLRMANDLHRPRLMGPFCYGRGPDLKLDPFFLNHPKHREKSIPAIVEKRNVVDAFAEDDEDGDDDDVNVDDNLAETVAIKTTLGPP